MIQQTTPPPDAAAHKAALRRDVLARRNALAEDLRLRAGVAIADLGGGLVAHERPGCVSVFVSIRGEIDTAPLMKRLAAAGVPLCLPVIVARGQPLVFRSWRPGQPLEEKRFGLLEPQDSAPEVIPDLLFVPLAAFDDQGFRLGYGGGFYDRTLERLRADGPATAIGLAFSAQQVDAVPTNEFDQRLDGVLTENGSFDIDGAAA